MTRHVLRIIGLWSCLYINMYKLFENHENRFMIDELDEEVYVAWA